MATREVGLLKLVEPEFLTLATSPANQTGFKIIRSKQEEDAMAHTDRNLRVRSRKARADGLMSIDLPAGISEEDAKEVIDTFGLGDDYELAVDSNGGYYAKRTGDHDNNVSTTPIDLGNGYVANIATETLEARTDSTVAGVTLVGLEFDETFEDVDSVKRWIEERDINFKANGVETFEGGTAVTRHDTPEGNEVRKVRLDNGVTGIVAKTKDTDVPDKVYRSVVEQSYGNWGWGHLNFATALADPAFTDASWDAIYVLRDVLENVIIYSGLPLDDRKSLVQNVCDQFTQYMTSLIDSLPREVIETARADRNQDKEPIDMAIEKKQEKVERNDGAVAEDADNTNDTTETTEAKRSIEAKGTEYVTREDLESVVVAAVAEAMKGSSTEEVERNDETDEGESTSEVSGSDNAMVAAIEAMTGAVAKIGENLDSVTRSVSDMKGEIDELNGSTVARSDDDDDTEELDGTESTKRTDASSFDGMFGDRFSH